MWNRSQPSKYQKWYNRGVEKHLRYIRYLFFHKLYVGQECFKRGLYWRGLWHDLDKFVPSRWNAYAEFFYGGRRETDPQSVKEAFVISWMRHAARNDHHWQYWVSISDNGRIRPHEMSRVARKEMLCDWIGAHKAVGGHNLLEWYKERALTIPLAPKTKRWIETEL